jgi:aryl-alcohol dehydrogenase-like predicted oxidoreductase
MRYRVLGGTGINVSELCLGAMMFGAYGNRDHDECVAIVHRALDVGINFVDTADVYSRGESETILGRALAGRRDDVVVATKFFNAMGEDPNQRGGSRRWIMRACEGSLRRLGTDHIDLYQMHRPDFATDIEETMSALDDLVRQGKVRAIGSSTFPAEVIVEAQWAAERRGTVKLRSEQPPYSIFARGVERAVLPTCGRYGMGVIPWGPLNGGWLTGKYRRDAEVPPDSRFARLAPARALYSLDSPQSRRKLDILDELRALAAEAGTTLIHLALAFVLEHPAVTAAIIGPRTLPQLEDHLGADELELDPAVLDRIDELVPPGTDVDDRDAWFQPPAISDPRLRRRR